MFKSKSDTIHKSVLGYRSKYICIYIFFLFFAETLLGYAPIDTYRIDTYRLHTCPLHVVFESVYIHISLC